MKAIDIALRDMLRSFRSLFAVMFMFVVPLMITGIMYVAMGGAAAGDEPSLPRIPVQVVNLDSTARSGAAGSGSESFEAGSLIVDVLESEDLENLLSTSVASTEAAARNAVDRGEASIAVIIPEGFSDALAAQGDGSSAASTIVLVQDPTLTISPAIVKAILSQTLDVLNGSRIAVEVVVGELVDAGLSPEPAAIEQAITRYTTWAQESAAGLQEGETTFAVVRPATEAAETTNAVLAVVGSATAAMLVFYVFFTGSAVAQSTLKEEEEGTLHRLLTTPVTPSTILSGKILGAVLTLIVQIAVLLALSHLLFGVQWGQTLPVVLAATGLIALASSFGIFIMSMVKSSNQLGVVYGAVITITSLFGTYPYFLPLPEVFKQWSLVVPQGWAMRAWDLAMSGGGVGPENLTALAVSLALSAVFFTIGALRFRRRFAP